MDMSLLCTTRFDPCLEALEWNNAPDGSPSPYLLLAFQLDRFLSSAHQCQWKVPSSLSYAALKNICDNAVHEVNGATDSRTPLKIRVIFPPSGNITASASPIGPLRYDPTAAAQFNPDVDVDTHLHFGPILSICMDTRSTSGTVPMKTTNRELYDNARARVGIPPLGALHSHNTIPNHPDDVILFNTSGAIIESSICNVAFYRHGRWLTPPLTVGCIPGVFRRWLLENGRIYVADEHSLSLGTIKDSEWVLLFNGVMGCRLGRVCCHKDPSSFRNVELH